MGMYTQVRGWLNVDSIGNLENKEIIEKILKKAKTNFITKYNTTHRTYITNHTKLLEGGNGSKFIFFGTELKNYNEDCEIWIEFLLKYFTNAEGRIDFQYEECSEDRDCIVLKIFDGKVISKEAEKTWCTGYGNMFKERRNKNGIYN